MHSIDFVYSWGVLVVVAPGCSENVFTIIFCIFVNSEHFFNVLQKYPQGAGGTPRVLGATLHPLLGKYWHFWIIVRTKIKINIYTHNKLEQNLGKGTICCKFVNLTSGGDPIVTLCPPGVKGGLFWPF